MKQIRHIDGNLYNNEVGNLQIVDRKIQYVTTQNPMLRRLLENSRRHWLDRCRQAMAGSLWGNNPGELERWADDGGREP